MNAKLPFSGASPRDPAIDIARLICIFCVVYVHGGTGHPMEITRALPFRDSYAYWILVEGLGRSSVPLLSIISGWLVAEPGKRLSIGRSEEHTSELQSLMRISYAVFCLKKKRRERDIKW